MFFTTSAGISTGAGITGGGSSATVTKSVANDGALEALFFSITGAAAGDTYTVGISGPRQFTFSFGQIIDIMGISFDSTPEPSTLAGCAAASLALIWVSRVHIY